MSIVKEIESNNKINWGELGDRKDEVFAYAVGRVSEYIDTLDGLDDDHLIHVITSVVVYNEAKSYVDNKNATRFADDLK